MTGAQVGEAAADRGLVEARGGPPAAVAVAAKVLLPVAVALWALSLRHVRLDHMSGLGLVSVLPVLYWAALGALTVGFALTVTDRRIPTVWLAGYVVVLIMVLHATPSILYPELRYSWAWKHVSIISYLTEHRGTDPAAGELDPYFQWPGFFSLNALFLKATGLKSALSYAAWAPLVNNLALIVPLHLIYRSISRERWLIWGGIWVFFAASWIGQDYFSPQAFAFLLFLVVVALVLRHGARPRTKTETGTETETETGTAAETGSARPRPAPALLVLFLILLVLIVTIDSSHQLTPVLLVTTLAALAVVLRTKFVVALLVSAVAVAVAWDGTVAWPFIHSQLPSIIKALGNVDANATSGIVALNHASRGQVVVADVDRALTGLVCLLAVAGLLLRRVPRRPVVLALILAPLPLVVASDYGGEIIYRVYLFALPALALGVAGLVCRPTARWWVGATARCVVFAVLIAGCAVSYYGKEEANYFSPTEATASEQLFATAPPGSLIIAATNDFPGAYTRFWDYDREWFGLQDPQLRLAATTDAAHTLADLIAAEPPRPVYVILTRSQRADSDLSGLFPAGSFDRMAKNLDASPLFAIVYQSPDATVYKYVPPQASSGQSTAGGTG